MCSALFASVPGLELIPSVLYQVGFSCIRSSVSGSTCCDGQFSEAVHFFFPQRISGEDGPQELMGSRGEVGDPRESWPVLSAFLPRPPVYEASKLLLQLHAHPSVVMALSAFCISGFSNIQW